MYNIIEVQMLPFIDIPAQITKSQNKISEIFLPFVNTGSLKRKI